MELTLACVLKKICPLCPCLDFSRTLFMSWECPRLELLHPYMKIPCLSPGWRMSSNRFCYLGSEGSERGCFTYFFLHCSLRFGNKDDTISLLCLNQRALCHKFKLAFASPVSSHSISKRLQHN